MYNNKDFVFNLICSVAGNVNKIDAFNGYGVFLTKLSDITYRNHYRIFNQSLIKQSSTNSNRDNMLS